MVGWPRQKEDGRLARSLFDRRVYLAAKAKRARVVSHVPSRPVAAPISGDKRSIELGYVVSIPGEKSPSLRSLATCEATGRIKYDEQKETSELFRMVKERDARKREPVTLDRRIIECTREAFELHARTSCIGSNPPLSSPGSGGGGRHRLRPRSRPATMFVPPSLSV